MEKSATLLVLVCILVISVDAYLPKRDQLSGLHRPLAHRIKNQANSAIEAQWFDHQVVDHFTPGFSGTFSQRYYVNETFWKGNGYPVFLILGGEGPISPSDVVDHFIIPTYAEQFNALVISVEHRFYGETQPFSDTSVENLRYLTTPQALADFALFQEYIVDSLEIPDSKWIAWGGSYSGNLSAWLRLKYPHLFVGSIASSAPVAATLDFSEYLVTVGADLGSDCYNAFAAATSEIEEMLLSQSNFSELESTFSTCKPIVNSSLDFSMFMEAITDGPCGIAQYSNDNNDYEAFNVSTMCNEYMLNKAYSSPVVAWGALVNAINQFNGATCTAVHYQTYIDELSLTDLKATAGRSWTWQTCTEFGYFQTGSSPDQPFSSLISLDFFLSICEDVFGEKYSVPNTNWTNEYFGSTNIAGTRIVFPNGSVDPWHNLGMWDITPSNPLEYPVAITGTAHCADLYPAKASDPTELTQCRSFEVQKVTNWLA